MTEIRLSPSLTLPAEIAGRRTGIFGISGSGKSNTATVILEQCLEAGEQIVLIDPKGEGWGLRSLTSGRPSKFDVIVFGEPNGDIPALTEHHGPELADFVVESGRSVVLSLLGFESDSAERRFVASFLRQIYRRKTKSTKRTRTLIVFEEAHLFMPEGAGRGLKGDTAELSGACQRIVRQGRSFGLGSLIVDQRPQDVAKRIVTQLDTLVCHQLTHKLDREALRDWVAGHADADQAKQFLDSLAALDPGEAWVWSPAWLKIFQRVKVARRRSFDSGAAPDDSAAVSIERKPVDIDSLKTQLSRLVDEAKANDPAELKRQIAELKRQLAAKPATAIDPAAIEKAANRAATERDIVWKVTYEQQRKELERVEDRLVRIAQLAAINGMKKIDPPAITAHGKTITVSPKAITNPVKTIHRPAVATSYQKGKANPPAGGLTPRQQKFLDAAASLATLGAEVSRETVAGWIGVHPRGGSVGEELKALVDAGMIDVDRGRITVTEAGHGAAGHVDPGEAIERAKSGLTSRQRKFFDVICEAYPHCVSRETIAEHFGIHPRGGSLGEDLGRLAGRGLVERERGTYRARDFLFAGR